MTIQTTDIIPIKKVLGLNIEIPVYQRPYRWQESTALALFNDIIEAYHKKMDEYRIGTLILHKNNNQYDIIDGQQRMTTLTLLLYAMSYSNESLSLLKANYRLGSEKAIQTNFALFQRKIKELHQKDNAEVNNIKEFIINRCTIIQIITDSEQEAFQFFDSQNSRGKSLEPHDLLKAYHLREMKQENEQTKHNIIEHWENLNQKQVSAFFKDYLYPILRWHKKRHGLGYNANKIQIFKGIKPTNIFPYATYHKASHLFIEEFNTKNYSDLMEQGALNQFILTNPVIAGRRFFQFVRHYYDLNLEVEKILADTININLLPNRKRGDQYIKRLLICVLMMIADRFGIKAINQSIINFMYTWAYSLRLVMNSVYEETINKYAIGAHERINQIAMFEKIAEMTSPQEIESITLNHISNDYNQKNNKAYKLIAEHIKNMNAEGFIND